MSDSVIIHKKLAILYILRRLDKGITKPQLVEFVLRYDIMNFFELQQLLDELIQSQLVDCVEEAGDLCLIKEGGSRMLELFDDRIPASVKDTLKEGVAVHIRETSPKAVQEGEYVKIGENDYTVTLRLQEGERVLFKLDLNAFTVEQARAIVNNWKTRPTEVYQSVLALLEGR